MSDYNVFAILTPYEKNAYATTTFELPHNAKRFRRGARSVAEEPTIDSREPTPDLADIDLHNPTNNSIVLTFNEQVKDPENMWQFGTNPKTCDILLGYRGTVGISAKHCNLTIDAEKRCIWLHDHSSHGTAVGYDDDKINEVRKGDTWILSYGPDPGSEVLDRISIHVGVQAYRIEFPNHRLAHPEYIKNLQAFIKKCKNAAPPFEGLGLDSDPPTQAPSQVRTPSAHPIYLHKELLGSGTFGKVCRAIKVRDGEFYAAKFFLPPRAEYMGHTKSGGKRKQDEIDGRNNEAYKAWLETIRAEFTIMQKNPHPNIVRVIEFVESPEPVIYMELYPLGTLEDTRVHYDQNITVFAQILRGLRHLHRNGVVHRDLKPTNFLIKKNPLRIAITDFGLSKVKDNTTVLQTFCGTLMNLAPEAFPGLVGDGYGTEVDIWSAGVIMLDWMFGIPKVPDPPKSRWFGEGPTEEQWSSWAMAWKDLILKKLGDEDADDKVVKILVGMLEPDPKKRWSADRCLKHGRSSGLFRMATDGRIIGENDTNQDAEDDDAGDGTKTPTARSHVFGMPTSRQITGQLFRKTTRRQITGKQGTNEDSKDDKDDDGGDGSKTPTTRSQTTK